VPAVPDDCVPVLPDPPVAPVDPAAPPDVPDDPWAPDWPELEPVLDDEDPLEPPLLPDC
jgi:hypothetical protein